jgi:haloacetate dehalogenase
MASLEHERFSVVGHDRGGLYAFRLALDHPTTVTRVAVLDCLPSEHLDRINARFATAWWHWFFLAQPEIPERVINADPESWYRGDPNLMGQANYEEWRAMLDDPAVVRGMLEDYRAGLTINLQLERASLDLTRSASTPGEATGKHAAPWTVPAAARQDWQLSADAATLVVAWRTATSTGWSSSARA